MSQRLRNKARGNAVCRGRNTPLMQACGPLTNLESITHTVELSMSGPTRCAAEMKKEPR
jgi:hypothetical protein